ncbi:Dabb family protein [Microbacterium marinilacus]|uniref:Dabb family protein n=1 Tax=Microbacterium marinilacus TaxID=415209 RepID=A0ABP7BCQ9_9MICO|nr:Dabb family protein [Microbacterium marinilacus]MBY0686942.1 Dabb family protein [Microbacterium marinilacus]
MIRHIVLFQLASTDPAERAEQFAESRRRVRALVGVVPGVRELDVHANALDDDRNADIAIVGDFDDLAAVEAYATHPAHVEVIEYIASIRTDVRAAIDFEV